MKPVHYGQLEDGQTIEVPKELVLGCCDCGLVHRMLFKIAPPKKGRKLSVLTMQVFRDNRRTAIKRRQKGVKIVQDAKMKDRGDLRG